MVGVKQQRLQKEKGERWFLVHRKENILFVIPLLHIVIHQAIVIPVIMKTVHVVAVAPADIP